MRWQSVLSRRGSFREAMAECLDQLTLPHPHLLVVFASAAFQEDYQRIPRELHKAVDPQVLIGCSAAGVIGAGQEAEGVPSLSLTAAQLPDVELHGFHLETRELPDEDAPPDEWREAVQVEGQPDMVVLSEPFSMDPEALLAGLDYAFPHSKKVGGLVSGARRPEGHALFLGPMVKRQGAVGLALRGKVRMEAHVAQGCRPIGPSMVITGAEGCELLELDGKPALMVLSKLLHGLNEADRRLAETSLFAGLRMESVSSLLSGQVTPGMLIRNLIGVDRARGSLGISAILRVGQALQFHLHDARASTQDLQLTLERVADVPAGGLLFSCLGRGERLYGEPSHDSGLVTQRFPDIALGGFFCNGEIGPVGPATYLHSYTASLALFTPA